MIFFKKELEELKQLDNPTPIQILKTIDLEGILKGFQPGEKK